MTSTQNQAIWELCLQGLQEAAQRAERSWLHGRRFEPEPRMPLTRSIAHLIASGNWEAQAGAGFAARGAGNQAERAFDKAA